MGVPPRRLHDIGRHRPPAPRVGMHWTERWIEPSRVTGEDRLTLEDRVAIVEDPTEASSSSISCRHGLWGRLWGTGPTGRRRLRRSRCAALTPATLQAAGQGFEFPLRLSQKTRSGVVWSC